MKEEGAAREKEVRRESATSKGSREEKQEGSNKKGKMEYLTRCWPTPTPSLRAAKG